MTQMVTMNRRGVTLIELLMTIIIGSIAVLAMWPPFVAERLLWNKGKRQTEAQRDAQMALRSMARFGRESRECTCTPSSSPPGSADACSTGNRIVVRFRYPSSSPNCFIGRPSSQGGSGEFFFNPGCLDGDGILLIDGVRSRLEEMTATEVVDNRTLQIHLRVSHQLRTTDTRQEDEVLDTTLFLRNG